MHNYNPLPSEGTAYGIFHHFMNSTVQLPWQTESRYYKILLSLLHLFILWDKLVPNISVDISKPIENNNNIIETKCYNKLHVH